jgi:taurine dioxygenase
VSLKSIPLMPFGVKIDRDLSIPLTLEEADELQLLYATHHLMLFQNQKIDRETQERVTGLFGPILGATTDFGDFGKLVSTDEKTGILGRGQINWHQDNAFCPEPIQGISLLALDVPAGQTSTRYTNNEVAYAKLSPETKETISGRYVVDAWSTYPDRRNYAADIPASAPRASHPIVGTTARTGEPYVFVCDGQSIEIEGLALAAAEKILDEIFDLCYCEDNIYEHYWTNGDLVIWDNFALQHQRGAVSDDARRVLQRATLGTKGMFEQYPDLAEVIKGYAAPLPS